jgi:hypothetical protein
MFIWCGRGDRLKAELRTGAEKLRALNEAVWPAISPEESNVYLGAGGGTA